MRDSVSEELSRLTKDLKRTREESWVWFAGLPLARVRDHVPVCVSSVQDILNHLSYFTEFSDRKTSSSLTPLAWANDLAPTLRGIAVGRRSSRHVVLEFRRDGTVVFAIKLPVDRAGQAGARGSAQLNLWSVYEPILSGLHTLLDVQDRFAMGKANVVQAGLFGFKDMRVIRTDHEVEEQPAFSDAEILLDAIYTPDNWKPRDIFVEWSRQIANALGQEEPLACPPWVK